MEFSHKTVLPEEAVQGLGIHLGGIYVDGTTGGGGHTEKIAIALNGTGHIYAFDKDPSAIEFAKNRLSAYENITFIQEDFSKIKECLSAFSVSQIDGLLLDLGVSSHQLDEPERGFSYLHDAPLDMRMSQTGLTAADIVNTWSEEEITRILFQYGEEKYARSIARGIVAAREDSPIETTFQLAEIVSANVPAKVKREKNPSRKTFQALRIAVNGELDSLEKVLSDGFELLAPKGRVSVITFHSLEDRMVKQTFAMYAKGCTCPPDFPICVCEKTPRGELINRKPIAPTEDELESNRRSRSAKLRIIEKIS